MLNGCKELTQLWIHRNTLEALPLESLGALTWLNLYQRRMSAAALRGLRGNKNLAEVFISEMPVPIGGELITILASCPNLQGAYLYKAGLEAALLQPLTKLNNLRWLHIGGNDYSETQLSALSNSKSLDSLNLSGTDLTDQSLDFLRHMRSLSHLELSGLTLSESAYANIALMPALTHLSLFGTNISDQDLRCFGGHKTLRILNLGQTCITGQGLQVMKPISSLGVLNLEVRNPRPGNSMLAALPVSCPNLTELVVNSENLESSDYQSLVSLKKLNRLSLHNANLNEESMQGIAKMKNLTALSLYRSTLTSPLLLLSNHPSSAFLNCMSMRPALMISLFRCSKNSAPSLRCTSRGPISARMVPIICVKHCQHAM